MSVRNARKLPESTKFREQVALLVCCRREAAQRFVSVSQWRNLSAAAPANAGGPEGPEGAQWAQKGPNGPRGPEGAQWAPGPTKMVYQICERLVNIECKTLKRVVFTFASFDAHKISLHSFINTWDVLMYNTVRNVKFSFASILD